MLSLEDSYEKEDEILDLLSNDLNEDQMDLVLSKYYALLNDKRLSEKQRYSIIQFGEIIHQNRT